MFAAPRIEAVESFLSSREDDDGSSMALMTEVVLPMETSRRRPLGQHPAFLVDVSWSAASAFKKPARVRGTDMETLSFQVSSVAARPEATGSQQVADSWVADAEDELLAEYVTAESEVAAVPDGHVSPVPPAEVEDTSAELARLRARLAQLESQGAVEAPPRTRARDLFQVDGEPLTGEDWARLKELAGQPPPRLARHEVAGQAHLDPAAADALAELSAGAIPEAALDAGPETSVLHRLLPLQTASREDLGLPTFGCCDSRFGNRRQREHCCGSGVCGPRGFPPPTVPTRGCGRCRYCQRSSRVGTEHRRSLFELDAGVCESQGAFRRPSAAFLHGHVVCSRLAVGPHSRECSATSLGQPRSDVLRTGRPRRGSLPAGMDVDRPPTSGLPFAVPASPEVARAALCNLGQADLGSRLHLVPEGDELPRKPGDRSPGFRRSNRQWHPRGGRRSSEAPSTTFEGKGKGSGPVNPMSPIFAATRPPGVFSKLVSATGKVLNLPCRRRPAFRPRRVWISGQVCSRVSGGSSALEDPFVDVPLGAGHVRPGLLHRNLCMASRSVGTQNPPRLPIPLLLRHVQFASHF